MKVSRYIKLRTFANGPEDLILELVAIVPRLTLDTMLMGKTSVSFDYCFVRNTCESFEGVNVLCEAHLQ